MALRSARDSPFETLDQVFDIVFVHEEADRAAVHAVDRYAVVHVLVQGRQHQTVTAERDDHLGNARVDAVVFGCEIGKCGLRDVVVAGNERDTVESRSSVRHRCRL